MNRVEKIEKQFNFIRTASAILLALIIAFLLILSVSNNPFKDFTTLLVGPLQNKSRLISVISKMIPVLFTGVAIALVNSANQINIAAEGAFFGGCVAATIVAIIPGIPPIIHPILSMLAAFLVGALIMGIPGILHTKFDVVTIVSSLMINYVALYGGLYLILNPLKDASAGFEASLPFASSAVLYSLFGEKRIHIGLFVAIFIVVIASILIDRTTFGFKIKAVGQNKKFAIASGIDVNKTIVKTSLLAGGIAGLGGATEILGNYKRFVYTEFTNHGWDGIMIAVLCRNNPKLVPLGAFFLSYIKTSADALNMTSSIPTEIVSIIQATIIIFVAAERFMSNWEHKRIVEATNNSIQLKGDKTC